MTTKKAMAKNAAPEPMHFRANRQPTRTRLTYQSKDDR